MGATRYFNHTGGGVASCDIWQSSSAHLDIFATGRWENYTTAHFYNTCAGYIPQFDGQDYF